MSSKSSIFISAGDPSADFPGKNLIDEITRACPGIDIFGLGGPLMQAAGLSSLVDYRDLAVLGFWEIVPRFRFFSSLLRRTTETIEEKHPRAIILLDYPGFNLRLAERVRRLNIPIIYYISPQVWAWGKRRIKVIKKLVDLMLVIFPFEEEFYRSQGIPAYFTGHPIVDRYGSVPDKSVCRQEAGLGGEGKLIALLPGSRLQEIKRMLPVMAAAAEKLRRKISGVEFVVAGVENIGREVYQEIVADRAIPIMFKMTPEILKGADFVITSSGTATIEIAYFGTPMVIIYKTGFLTYQIAKRLITLDSIGMVNIVSGRKIVPELIQHDANTENIVAEVLSIMGSRERCQKMRDDLGEVREKLGSGNSGRQAYETIVREIGSLC